MPPPEGSGILTLYGHRLPSLYRAGIESRMSVSAKGRALASCGSQGAVGRPQERFCCQGKVGVVLHAQSVPNPFRNILGGVGADSPHGGRSLTLVNRLTLRFGQARRRTY